MGRQVGGSVEVTQEVSALASVGPLKRCGVQLCSETPLKNFILKRQKAEHLLPSDPVVLETVLEVEIVEKGY